MNVLRGMLVIGLAVGLSACGSNAGSGSASSPQTPSKIDATTLSELGACVVDRMQGGTSIDRVQVFAVGHDSALNLFLRGPVPADPPGDPSYVLWVTGADAPEDVISEEGTGPLPSGPTLGVWMIEPVKRGPMEIGQDACQGSDWGVVKESQGVPALERLGGSVDMPKQDYDIAGPPTGSP